MRALICFISVIFFSVLFFVSSACGDETAGYSLTVQSTGPDRIVLDLTGDSLRLEPIRDGNMDWEIPAIPAAGITSRVGAPALPLISHLLPLGASESVEATLVVHEAETIENVDLWPFQQPAMRGDVTKRLFAIDEDLYAENRFWPAKAVDVGAPAIVHGIRVAPITIHPLRYNPATRKGIWIRRAEIALRFDRSGGENPVRSDSPGATRLFTRILQPLLLTETDRDSIDPVIHEDGAYLILTSSAFLKQVEPLVEWKRRKGFPVEVFTTEDTGKTAIEIRHFLSQRYYSTDPPLDYVLLVGDIGQVPSFYGMDGGPADSMYGLLEGDDYLPDVIVGRLPAETRKEAATAVAKMVRYETEPPTGNDDWYGSALMISGSDKVDDENASFCGDVCEIYGGYERIGYLFDSQATNTRNNTSAGINQGVSWITYFGHGSRQSWKSIDPHFENENVLSLENSGMLPVITSIACSNGAFDDDQKSFAETWINREGNQGAAAVLAASRSTPFYYTDILGKAVNEGYFKQGLPSYGAACLFGKLKMYSELPEPPGGSTEQVIQHFNLFGDPELNVWTRRPLAVEADYPSVLPHGKRRLSVTVTNQGRTLAGAVVRVSRPGSFSFATLTDAAGTATLNFPDEIRSGGVELTVLGEDLIPVRGTLQIQGQDDEEEDKDDGPWDWLEGCSCG